MDGSSNLICRTEVVCLRIYVALIDFRCLKVFDCLTTVLVGGGSSNGNEGSLPGGSGIRMYLGVVAGVIAGAAFSGDRRGL